MSYKLLFLPDAVVFSDSTGKPIFFSTKQYATDYANFLIQLNPTLYSNICLFEILPL
jgi:hypothetical protein